MAEKKRPTVYFSNKLEQLANSLGEVLWQKGEDPFVKRTVILPHHGLKSYLTSFFARHPNWNISVGVEYKILVDGVKSLLTDKEKFPSEMALCFAIEQEIYTILEDQTPSSLFLEMRRYVGPLKNENKIRWIAKELAHLFYEYGMFEPKALGVWLRQNGWEIEIWKRVFAKFSNWRVLSELLPLKKGGDDRIHLFGFSHIPSHFYDFFCKFSVKFYFLSPSEMFWEDLCSDKERIYLEKKMEKGRVRLQIQDQLRFFLTKTHPLLANWGRSGRPLLARFGQMECYLEEKYCKETALGVLGHIQNSLLELEDGSEKKQISKNDTSILCVSASSKLREVEILLQTLQELMRKAPIEPKDVLVLVSDLKSYLPYIHAVFGSLACPFSYSVHGIFSKKNPRKGITSFLSMIEERFSLDSVFAFLSLPSVMTRWDFTFKDLSLLRRWFEKVHVLWGLCPKYKKECLQKTAPDGGVFLEFSEGGTWDEAIEKLLHKLAIDEKNSSFSIDWTQAELLGRFIYLMDKIKEELRPIYEEQKKSFVEWILFLRRWSEIYLDSTQTEEGLFQELEALSDELLEISNAPLPFDSFVTAVDNYFERKKESFQSSHLQSVKFISLEKGSASPCQVLYVLGCDEESFPKVQKVFCFEKSFIQKETPSLSDLSRYIFLELLLHARSSLIFSYPRISSQDQKIQGPCRMVEELFSYLDARFIFSDTEKKPSEILRKDHPSLSFAKEYFQDESCFVNFSSEAFSLAKSYYGKKKEVLPYFFPSWQKAIRQENNLYCQTSVEINKLQDFAKNPLRFYFKEKLNIFFEFSVKEDKEFFLSPITQRKIITRALKHSLEESVEEATSLSELPLGPLGKIAKRDLLKELEKWKEGLRGFGLQESDLFFLEFVDGVRVLEKRVDRIILPPLVIEVEGTGFVSLEGYLPYVSAKGFIWPHKKKKEEWATLWPSFLVFLCVAKELSLEKECLFLGDGKRLGFYPEDPQKVLSKYLKLYMRSIQEPCPILPNLLPVLLKGSEEELEKKMEPSSYATGFLDPYEQWTLKRDPPPIITHIQKEWKADFEEVYLDLLEGVDK